MSKQIAVCTLVAITILSAGPPYPRLVAAGTEANQGPMFHDVAAGTTANFVVRGATAIHVVSYFVLPPGPASKPSYELQLAFLSHQGVVRVRHSAILSLVTNATPTTLADGAALAQVRLLALRPPPGTSLLQLRCPDGRVLLRANRLAPTKASQETVMERSGRPAVWFAKDELQGLRSTGFMPLPILAGLPTVKLPPIQLTQVEADAVVAAAPALLPLGPHQAQVVNVIGPGTMKLAQAAGEEQPSFQVEYIGPGGSGTAPVMAGRAELTLPAGPSSVIIRPLDEKASLLQVAAQKLRALGRSDQVMEPAARPGSAWRVSANASLRFPIYGSKSHPNQVRLTAHAVDLAASKTVLWRFVNAGGKKLLGGALQLSSGYDPFTALMEDQPVDLGLVTRTVLTPPDEATALELAAASALVEVDTLMEKGAQADPLPPFDVPLGPQLRWQDAPVRKARWVMLRPLAPQSEQRQLFAQLVRRPRIVSIAPLPQGPWIQVMPHGHVKKLQIIEPMMHKNPELEPQTLIRIRHTAAVMVPQTGKNAHRVVANCELPGRLGGRLTLRLDGHTVASAPILTSAVRLAADAPADRARVRVEGAARGQCVVAAQRASSPMMVRRSVFLVPPHKGLMVKVNPRGMSLRLHYALYTAEPDASRTTAVAVVVDRGEPTRRAGSANAATLSQGEQVLPLAEASLPSRSVSGEMLQRVAVAAVQLGDDLSAGRHQVKLQVRSAGRYWARFWIEGKRRMPEAAESFISSDSTEPLEVQP